MGMAVKDRSEPKVYIVILNWNGWRDTIECLESVLRQNYRNYKVIVCDNASSDNSLNQIKLWSQGRRLAQGQEADLQMLIAPPIQKPIDFYELDVSLAPVCGKKGSQVILIQTGANLGFAGGVNVGLRYALTQGDLDFAWILNNDTIVHPEALQRMIDTAESDQTVGMCGATLLDYRAPHRVQSLGGATYNRFTARVSEIGKGLEIGAIDSHCRTFQIQMDYVQGASILVSRRLLDDIGLLKEKYFLYFEEIDWATRVSGRFKLAYSPGSYVYHKDGASTGTANEAGRPSARLLARRRWASPLSEFYTARNRLIFTWSYYPLLLPSVCTFIAISCVQRLLYRKWHNCSAIVRGVFAGLRSLAAKEPRFDHFQYSPERRDSAL